MSNPKRTGIHLLVLASFFAIQVGGLAALADGPVLKGGATKEDRYSQGPSLSRTDIKQAGDPFGGGPPDQTEQVMENPNFGVEKVAMPPPPPRPLQGAAQDESPDQFNGQMMPGVQDQMPNNGRPLQGNLDQPNQMVNPNDPDSSPDMQIAWEVWHKRVAESVYVRFTKLSNAAFQRSRPLLASASYTITRDGRVVNARLLQKSWNPIFNTLVLGVINSISGDLSITGYPPGSRRMAVEKAGTFTQNYGHEGYTYLQGDQERIQAQPHR